MDQRSDYGICLRKVIKEMGLSAAAVSRALGHKSRTTLHRVVSGEASHTSTGRVNQEFIEHYRDMLTDKQIALLNNVLSLNQKDIEYHQVRDILYNILFGQNEEGKKNSLFVKGVDNEAWNALFRKVSKARQCRFLVLNCLNNGALFTYINTIFSENTQVDYLIRHYVVMPSEKATAAMKIMEMLPVLFRHRYSNIVFASPAAGETPAFSAPISCSSPIRTIKAYRTIIN